MENMWKYLEKIGKELERLNNNIEKNIEIAEQASKPIEVRSLTAIEQAKWWMTSVLNEALIDIAREFSRDVSNIDINSIEYEEKLLKALKQIRAVMKIRDTIDEFLTEDGLAKAIEKLEEHLEYERKSSAEKTKEAMRNLKVSEE